MVVFSSKGFGEMVKRIGPSRVVASSGTAMGAQGSPYGSSSTAPIGVSESLVWKTSPEKGLVMPCASMLATLTQ